MNMRSLFTGVAIAFVCLVLTVLFNIYSPWTRRV